MKGYLSQIFTGTLNPAENIKPSSEEFSAAMQKLAETQNRLKTELSTEQSRMLEEMLAQKDLTAAFETFEAFLAGAKFAFGIWKELAND